MYTRHLINGIPDHYVELGVELASGHQNATNFNHWLFFLNIFTVIDKLILFQISQISTARFLTASLIGMFPTQGMHAYVGSTLRSMEEVISSSSNSFTGQLVFIAQVNLFNMFKLVIYYMLILFK